MASSSLFSDYKSFRQYRYHVVDIQYKVQGQGSIVIQPERLVEFSINNAFESNSFPLFKIKLILESEIYYTILKSKNEGQLYLRIDTYYTHIDNSDPSPYQACINDNFDLIMDEGTDDMLVAQKVKEAKYNFTSQMNSTLNNLKDTENATLEAYLFKIETINGTKTTISTVLQNATVTDAIGYCFQKAGLKNLIMPQPHNNKIYPELILPPLSAIKELSFIDTYYGLYTEGSLIYFGLTYNYIIPYNGNCSAYVNPANAIISILIPDSSLNHLGAQGELETGEGLSICNYIVGDYNTINIENQSISNDYTYANDITSVDPYSGTPQTSKSNAMTRDNNNTRVYTNTTENEFVGSTYAAQSKALSTMIRVNIYNSNILNLEPNRRYMVVFEDASYAAKYSGNYILSEVYSTFLLVYNCD